AARIAKDDVILTVRTYAKYKPAVFRAFRTATLKLPMATLSQENSNWGLTKIDREDYVRLRNEKKIIPQGSNVMYMNNKGPLSENFMKLAAAKPFQNTQASMKFSKNEVSDLQRPFRKFSLVAAQ
ncbi:MAG: 60S ribosomal protein L10, partial [Paramarteilia canceri]